MKKLLAILMAALLLCLAACNQQNYTDDPDIGYEGALPEVIFGTWHPHPAVSEVPFVINRDGSCVIGGQTVNWKVESADEDSVTLNAVGTHLTFTQLKSQFPLLSEDSVGIAMKDLQLWNYMIEWYDPNTGNAFTLDPEELAQIDCNVQFDNGTMTIEVLDSESVTYVLVCDGAQVTITTPDGFRGVYYPINGGDPGINTEDPQMRYDQAMNNLDRVLQYGNLTTYVDGNGEHHISDAEALERLYNVFVSLQNHMDVSEQLNYIRKVEHLPVSLDWIVDGIRSSFMEYTYDAFGSRNWVEFEEAASLGKQLYPYYDAAGNVASVEVWGLVKGEPVYDAGGKLTALNVTSAVTKEKYTAPVTCDTNGNVIRMEVPFVEDTAFGTIDHTQVCVYEFQYDANGRLLQYSETRHSTGGTYENTHFYETNGFHYETITECYYDASGKLTNTIEHQISINKNGIYNWTYSPSQYLYNVDGLLSSRIVTMGHVNPGDLSREEMENLDKVLYSLFHPSGFVNSIEMNLAEKIGEALSDVNEIARFEYNYGSIYVYTPEG